MGNVIAFPFRKAFGERDVPVPLPAETRIFVGKFNRPAPPSPVFTVWLSWACPMEINASKHYEVGDFLTKREAFDCALRICEQHPDREIEIKDCTLLTDDEDVA